MEQVAQPRTEHFDAEDGVRVGYHVLGEGPPVVIVHGSLATGLDWLQVAQLLAGQHRCYVLDRRWRGSSGNAEAYTLATEAGDIARLLAVAGSDAALVGHSYGGVCALESVRLGARPSALVLYEPPIPYESPTAGEHLQPYADAIERGDHEAAMAIGGRHFLRITPEEAAMVQGTPLWPMMLGLAPTWTRELREIDLTEDRVEEYAALDLPTLLLSGSDSPAHLAGACHWLAERMPNAESVVMPQQGHLANVLAPGLVADLIREFLARSR